MSLVHRPPAGHACPVSSGGTWMVFENGRSTGFHHDPAGTVRACECGRTWVSYTPHPMSGWAINLWRREGWIERKLRERRSRR